MNTYKRTGTSCLYSNARAAQVQLERGPGRNEILIIAEHDAILAYTIYRFPLANQLQQISAEARAGIDADQALVSVRVISGVFQRFPRRFQKQPMLRVCNFGLAGSQSKEH